MVKFKLYIVFIYIALFILGCAPEKSSAESTVTPVPPVLQTSTPQTREKPQYKSETKKSENRKSVNQTQTLSEPLLPPRPIRSRKFPTPDNHNRKNSILQKPHEKPADPTSIDDNKQPKSTDTLLDQTPQEVETASSPESESKQEAEAEETGTEENNKNQPPDQDVQSQTQKAPESDQEQSDSESDTPKNKQDNSSSEENKSTAAKFADPNHPSNPGIPPTDPNYLPPEPDENPQEDPTAQAGPIKQELDKQFKELFTTYVDKRGRVDYERLRRQRLLLINIMKNLDDLTHQEYLSWSSDQKKAFWINVYNAITLHIVVDNYPIEPKWYLFTYPDNSIMHITGAWEKKYFEIRNVEYTLREIESGILIKQFKDPRVIFALTYATQGGAFLRNEPYQAQKIEQQLDAQVRHFLESDRGMQIEQETNTLYLADFFSWERYQPAFEEYQEIMRFREYSTKIRGALNFIHPYLPEDKQEFLDAKNFTVQYINYDWELNIQPD